LVDIKNDTRLKFTSQETTAWLDDLSMWLQNAFIPSHLFI
jgi:hypothetical protein